MKILTYTKRLVNLADPDPQTIVVDDLVHGLSHECRFGGQTQNNLSVAQHSLMVTDVVESIDPTAAVHALLHDAHEAYLKDIPRPLKELLGATYTGLCDQMQSRIYQALHMEPPTDEQFRLIAEVDGRMLATEMQHLFVLAKPRAIELSGGYEPYTMPALTLMGFSDCKRYFFQRLRKLWAV